MYPALDNVQKLLKQLPGLGYRSAERLALHLLVERPERLQPLLEALQTASQQLHRCPVTGNLCEDAYCPIYTDRSRRRDLVCIVEQIPDLLSIERAGIFRGTYHVLHGRLSPIQGIGPEHLHLDTLRERFVRDEVSEVILALSNDIEGEATCHYLQSEVLAGLSLRLTRIGFGLPSGGGITYADAATLRSALEARRDYR